MSTVDHNSSGDLQCIWCNATELPLGCDYDHQSGVFRERRPTVEHKSHTNASRTDRASPRDTPSPLMRGPWRRPPTADYTLVDIRNADGVRREPSCVSACCDAFWRNACITCYMFVGLLVILLVWMACTGAMRVSVQFGTLP